MATHRSDNNRIVYSSEFGRMCPSCGKPVAECVCHKRQSRARGGGIVRVRREVKGRRGKTVTTISGVPLDDGGLRELAAELKRRCGTGGTVKDGVIEIQGDHCDVIITEIKEKGYIVKRAGG